LAAARARIAVHAAAAAEGSPEALHQVRVGLRRLRAAGLTFGPLLQLPDLIRPKPVARFARRFGEGRDSDVLAALSARLAADLPPPSRQFADDFAGSLRKGRRRGGRRIAHALTGKRFQELGQALDDWLAAPRGHASAGLPLAVTLPDICAPAVAAVLLHAGWLVGTRQVDGRLRSIGLPSGSALRAILAAEGRLLHDLRGVVKNLRYQSEFLRPHLDAAPSFIGQLRDAQDLLGDLHDLDALRRRLDRFEPDWTALARHLNARLIAEERRLWRAWLPLRRPLLDPHGRAALRRALSGMSASAAGH
jgi:CHAD domain-containing protein